MCKPNSICCCAVPCTRCETVAVSKARDEMGGRKIIVQNMKEK